MRPSGFWKTASIKWLEASRQGKQRQTHPNDNNREAKRISSPWASPGIPKTQQAWWVDENLLRQKPNDISVYRIPAAATKENDKLISHQTITPENEKPPVQSPGLVGGRNGPMGQIIQYKIRVYPANQ